MLKSNLYKISRNLKNKIFEVKNMTGLRKIQHKSKMDILEETVEEIMKIESPNTPFDFLFRDNINDLPEIYHEVFKLPGKFKNKEKPRIFIPDNGSLEMDYLESALPDEETLFNESAINVEQETGQLKNEKKDTLVEYSINSTIILQKYCLTYVATNHDYKEDFIYYEKDGTVIKINFIIFNRERVYEILNTLDSIDYSKEEFSDTHRVHFINCLVFAKKPYAKDVVKTLCHLFIRIDKITLNNKKYQHSALCMMIKYHFDDEKTIKELITMITKSIPTNEQEKLPYEIRRDIRYAKKIKEAEQLKKSNEEYIKTINKQDQKIDEQDQKIDEQYQEIKKLKELLQKNQITY